MMMSLKKWCAIAATTVSTFGFASPYPFDPLTVQEQAAAVQAVTANLSTDPNASTFLFDKVELIQPPKAQMLIYQNNPIPANKPDRKALVNVWSSMSGN